MARFISIPALLATLVLPSIGSADGIDWKVMPDFENNNAAREISGAVCAGKDRSLKSCFAVNDEKKYIQLFSVEDRTLVPGERILVLPKDDDGDGIDWNEPDLEAVTYDDESVYLAGSHGAGRNSGKVDSSRFLVFRLPINDEGEPEFDISKDMVADEIKRTDRLRGFIKSDPALRDFAGKKLDENGANIEGLGVLGEDLYFGFRAPTGPRGAVILKVGVKTLFGDANEMAESFFVDLGAGYGIRDIARIDDRFLVLAGAAQDADLVPAIWSWAPDTDPRLLRILDVPGSRKAEGLMVLDWKDDKEIRVLVLFDSEKNGAPAEFTIPFE